MALTWDITKLKVPDEYKVWVDNPDPDRKKDEEFVMNGLTEVMIFMTMIVGINEITQKNYKDFHHRIQQFEIVSGESAMLVNKENPDDSRNPTLEEVKWHIGLKTNATVYTKRKWTGNVMRMLDETISKQDKELEDASKGDA